MTTINLRDYYPSLYATDSFIEVSDEVADAFIASEQNERAYQRRRFYNKAQYSLDQDDGIEEAILHKEPSVEYVFDRESTVTHILAILETLPKKQARRIYTLYFLGVGKSTIAKEAGITKRALNISIQCGLRYIRKELLKFL
ncbi:sigma-70 family RNA polymerase sigma factor [Ethanoligenens harbinense]|uniref:Sigma-70 family RNA polymerase sigma factor n=1 Tax=Ethanoligenens harbinense (strain DSM 18485 / JCM 12961 / CGMCC 1.5033 / YUAN-3) TaxID=663278 RepID=E6UA37_ETHHY|nr:sigma-70 family RNA polymerase sigma factor [Ethanoligenens harbinense]ADU27398.1 hypothetical protein Ethha_1876 [Ethanoligenens harbinense YUAN-3]AVQ96457.1 sigma-70 family RNA polymerase sigma factor [Ethanoligenens harbinense YUAN-3]AYF39116.1 sigma-70 family RNA polymerase sigma factor [Ethanoligenens harbinense]AYF41942.1 sigma-70 family RNA polymerase sigma factor [Ethanoligenens harbinense]QCN92698.1 sigma-70 family RNA polymerase sigma factor [Ethanoligenens harbinense]